MNLVMVLEVKRDTRIELGEAEKSDDECRVVAGHAQGSE